MTSLQAQLSKAGTNIQDRNTYVAYIKAATLLADVVEVQDRIKNDMGFQADRTPDGIDLRALRYRKCLQSFRTAQAAFLAAVTA